MHSVVRFLAWMAVVLAVGAQATGFGTLGFNVCMDRSGGICAIEAPGQRCCAEEAGEAADDSVPADICDRCVDTPLALPAATTVTSTHASDHLVVFAVPPTVVEWMLPVPRTCLADTATRCHNRGPPLPDSLLIAETIVLRI